jgi:peptidoglycan hydrolase FlgJ
MDAQRASQDKVLNSVEAPMSGKMNSAAEIKKVAEEFESLFLGLVLKSMRDTVQKSGLIDGGNAEDIYRSMLDTEYTKIMAEQRTTGIADSIQNFMMELGAGEGAEETPGNAAKSQAIKAYSSSLPPSDKRETMHESLKAASSIRLKAI